MALVPDQKFSTFQDGGDVDVGDIIVGLRGGINTKFNYTGELPPGVVVPISNGGTGATTAAQARINLGLGTIAVQDANAVAITGGSAALDTGSVVAAPVAGIDLTNKDYVDALVGGTVLSITGTANQVIASSPTGNVVLSLPQDIAPASSPSFAGLTLTVTPLGFSSGGTNRNSLPTTAVASSYAAWDVNSNLYANNFLAGFASTVSAAGTTVLTVASAYNQEVTGSTTQTLQMPVTSTLVTGFPFKVINNSSGNVTLTSSGGNTILVMAANTTAFLTCILTSGTTAASWNASYVFDNGAGVLSITGTANQIIASASTGAVVLSTPQDIATTSAVQFASVRLSNLGILDNNAATILALEATASAVDYITLVNQIGGFRPGFKAAGSSTNIGMGLQTKGTGSFAWQTGAPTNPILIVSGTGGVHETNFIMADTANSRSVTFPDATGTLLMTGVAINTVPSIAFSSTSGIIGTTTNDNAAAGSVGEFVSSTVSAAGTALTTATATNLTSISLTAGDWDVWGNVFFTNTSAANILQQGWISSTSATAPDASFIAQRSHNVNVFSGGFCVPERRFSLSGTTTVYITANVSFTGGGVSVCGGIYARRRR